MNKLITMAIAIFVAFHAESKVVLPSIVGDNMVLQRNTTVNVWGNAERGKRITITTSWNNKRYIVKTDTAGKWSAKVITTGAGGPYEIKIYDGDAVVLRNILLGEVWVCSGQSNMEMPMDGYINQPVEGAVEALLSSTDYPQIRLFNVPLVSSPTELYDCRGAWQESSPEAVSRFSAVGYFFALTLHRVTKVPVGMISASWGGSSIEAWMTTDALNSIEGINKKVTESWNADNTIPQRLLNGMIFPICKYAAKGFIWYQGETNRINWYDYARLQQTQIELWRKMWNDPSMPFYLTQLAPHNYEAAELRSLAMFVEAQYEAAAKTQNCGVATTTDLGNPICIHPMRKREIGERLAFLALAKDYGVTGLPAPAPTFKEMVRDGNKLVLSFNNITTKYEWNKPNSLYMIDNDSVVVPAGFEIAGADRKFHKAKSNYRLWDNTIEVFCDAVADPVAVRYAFRNYCPEANVFTTMRQPLVPFRTDRWEVQDIGIK